jgi:thioredoxin 1
MPTQLAVKSFSGNEFEALINENGLVFVDFWAPWCAPCRQFGDTYEKVASNYPDIVFAKINIEDEPELAEAFHIRSVPHLMVLKLGIVIYSESGSIPESTLVELIQQARDADVSELREQIDKDEAVG